MYERCNPEVAHGTRVVPAGHQRDSRHVRSACGIGDPPDGGIHPFDAERRGISIDLGFASWFTDEYQIGFIDVPGHERFVRTMVAGATPVVT